MTVRFKCSKRSFTLFAALFLVIVLYGASRLYLLLGPREAHYVLTASTSLTEETLGGFQLGQRIDAIDPPPVPDTNNSVLDYYRYADGTTVAAEPGTPRVVRIILPSGSKAALQTSKGIGIGDPAAKALAVYGDHYYRRSEQGAEIIGYIDKLNHSTLEFWLDGDTVSMIRLDSDELK
ncbi:hypothetical protein ACP26L_06880 [Paenibacillus sp. S-38]|uniref:hypothetical protein n=1 Tax=Paenibacillus sp. S-38 TaxID=3416710 RepID=UPI003CF47CDB